MSARLNLLGLTRTELEALCADMGSRPFRARQLMNWIYKRGVGDIDAMSHRGRERHGVAEKA